MKKLIFIAAFIGMICSAAWCDDVWKSSWTVTADTGQTLCNAGRRSILHGVCITKSDGGTLSLFNGRSASVVVSTFAVIQATSAISGGCQYFDVVASSGITYTSSLAGTSATILYDCY